MYWSPATIRCTAASSESCPVTGGGGVDARGLHRGDRTAGHAVVGGVDAIDAVRAQLRDRLLHLLLGLVGAPVGRVDLRPIRRPGRGSTVGALLVGGGVGVGGRAVDHHDARRRLAAASGRRAGPAPAAGRP